MKKLAVLLALFPAPAFAQQAPAPLTQIDYLKSSVGNCIGENSALAAQAGQLVEELNKRKARIDELEAKVAKLEPKPEAKPNAK